MPGVFGFLAWELKENWRLYAANRPRDLKPLVVGHHGETITEFLHPGFRSGTLPKLYARLRKSNRRAIHTGRFRSTARQTKELAGVEEHLRRFVQRRFFDAALRQPGLACRSAGVRRNSVGDESDSDRAVCRRHARAERLDRAGRSGRLAGGQHRRRGWLDQLAPVQRGTLANALAGFYKLAGVDLVREQLDAHLPPRERNLHDRRARIGRPLGPRQSPEVVYRTERLAAGRRGRSPLAAGKPISKPAGVDLFGAGRSPGAIGSWPGSATRWPVPRSRPRWPTRICCRADRMHAPL